MAVVMMSVVMMVMASPALAQDAPLRPPTTKEVPSSPKFIVMGVAVLLLALVVFVVTLRSKRGHQD